MFVICLQGQYVIAGGAEGALHVWEWETNIEICHIAAHKQRIHHCSLLANTGKLLCARFLFCLSFHIVQCNETYKPDFYIKSCLGFKT